MVALLAGTGVSSWEGGSAVRAERDAAAALTDARRQREQARRAVDDMYTQVATRWLAEQGSLTAVQQEFLEKALAFYEEFAAADGSDPQVRYETLRATHRVGAIQRRLRDDPAADAAYRRVVAECDHLVVAHPDQPRFRLARGAARRTDMVEPRCRQSSKPTRLVRWRPRTSYPFEAASTMSATASGSVSCCKICRSHWRRRTGTTWRKLRVRPWCERGRNSFGTTRAEIDYQFHLSAAYSAQGTQRLLADRGSDRAESDLRQAEARLSAFLVQRPNHSLTRRSLAQTLNNLGSLLDYTNRAAEAEVAFRRALDVHASLAAEFPTEDSLQVELAHGLENLGETIAKANGRPTPEAVKFHERSVAVFELLAKTQTGRGHPPGEPLAGPPRPGSGSS